MQRRTPVTVNAIGVKRVRARPVIDRDAIRRPPSVYKRWMSAKLGRLCRAAAALGDECPDPAAMDDRPGNEGDEAAGEAVEPEVVGGRHHREADPAWPEQRQGLQPPRAHDVDKRDPD